MRSKTSQKPSPENRKSAHEALFPGYRTLPSTSYSSAPKSDPLFANGNFNGTNNSAKGASYSSIGNLKKSNFSSKTSLVSSEYDNVKKSPRQGNYLWSKFRVREWVLLEGVSGGRVLALGVPVVQG